MELTYTIRKIEGNDRGDNLYAVIFLDESDLAGCRVGMYGGNSEDEVGNLLNKKGFSDMQFIIQLVGERESDINDL